MKHILPTAFLILLVSFGLDAQRNRNLKGSGNLTTEQRSITGFTGVRVSDAISLTVRYGSSYSVVIEADDNIIGRVKTDRSGSTLSIGMDDGNYRNTTVRAKVTMPRLTELRGNGASQIKVVNFQQSGEDLRIKLSGASSLHVDNSSIRQLMVDATGASSIRALDLTSYSADLDVSGASSIHLAVENHIRGSASGASSVRYRGRPSVNVNTNGASSIRSI